MSVYAIPKRPDHRRLGPRDEWEMRQDVTIHDGEREWQIADGTCWDYASVPRLARLLMETTDLGTVSTAVHDYLYRNGGWVLLANGEWHQYTRAEADALFLVLMKWEGVPWWRRGPAHRIVRIGGGGAWQHREPPEGRRAA